MDSFCLSESVSTVKEPAIKKLATFGGTAMKALERIFTSPLPTNFRIVQAMVFPMTSMEAKVGFWTERMLMLLNVGIGEYF